VARENSLPLILVDFHRQEAPDANLAPSVYATVNSTEIMASSRSRVFDSSVGTKILIGITGLALFVYLVIHVAGNLLVFLGPAFFN